MTHLVIPEKPVKATPRGALRVSRAALTQAGNELWKRLETWIAYNSGFCSAQDVEAIDTWRALTAQENTETLIETN